MLSVTYQITAAVGASPGVIVDDLQSALGRYSTAPDDVVVFHSVNPDRYEEMTVSLRIQPGQILLEERGIAGALAMLSGTVLRSPRIANAQIIAFIDEDTSSPTFPGPRYGRDLLGTSGLYDPLLSAAIPRSVTLGEFDQIVQALAFGGVRLFSDLTPSPGSLHISSRLSKMSKCMNPGNTSIAIFFNGTGPLEALLRNIDLIGDLTGNGQLPPNVAVGVRICPQSAGLSVLQHLRTHELPILAYCEGSPDGSFMRWRPTAFAQLVSLAGSDFVGTGLLSSRHSDLGQLSQTITAIDAIRVGGKRPGPLYTGALSPDVVYSFLVSSNINPIFHGLSYYLADGFASKAVETRAAALTEACEIALEGAEAEELFAQRSKRVRSWRKVRG